MNLPIYSFDAIPTRRSSAQGARDPERKRTCAPAIRLPLFKVVLRKEGTLRVPRTRIDTPDDAHKVAFALIGDRPFENSVALFISASNDITGAIYVGTAGSISSAPITVRGVFTGAIVHNAAAIILAHNHPSGNPQPSSDDIRTTEQMQKAAEILGIPILDHLVITRDPSRWQSITCR